MIIFKSVKIKSVKWGPFFLLLTFYFAGFNCLKCMEEEEIMREMNDTMLVMIMIGITVGEVSIWSGKLLSGQHHGSKNTETRCLRISPLGFKIFFLIICVGSVGSRTSSSTCSPKVVCENFGSNPWSFLLLCMNNQTTHCQSS